MKMRFAWVVMVAVGGLGVAGEAGACEAHAARTPPAASPEPRREEASGQGGQGDQGAPGKADGASALHAARCQCGSAADCTCKKGTCECAKCKPRHHEVPAGAEASAPRESPRDGGTGAGV